MFWETKLLELQKLAPVELAQADEGALFTVTIRAGVNEPFHKDSGMVASGETRAAAVCNLWSAIVNGDPFILNLENSKTKYRWNARWEVLEKYETKQDPPVVEEPADGTFDPAD